MKTILVLAAVMLTAAVSAKAEWVNGHFRSNGTYVDS
jgi:Flp pilus assembly pilin Flp